MDHSILNVFFSFFLGGGGWCFTLRKKTHYLQGSEHSIFVVLTDAGYQLICI